MEGNYTEALGRTDLLILLQKFARYYLTEKLSQAPAQELETKAELLQAGKPQDAAGDVGETQRKFRYTLLGSIPFCLPPSSSHL